MVVLPRLESICENEIVIKPQELADIVNFLRNYESNCDEVERPIITSILNVTSVEVFMMWFKHNLGLFWT